MSSIEEELSIKSRYERELTDYIEELRERSNKAKLEEFIGFRKFGHDVVNECGIFYVGEMTEMLVPRFIDSLKDFGVISATNNKPIYSNRYIIPIKNKEGLVQNIVGYSADANERYIYSTSKYYRRKDTLWGLENLGLAYEMGYAIVVEGITDAIRLRDMGYKNTFAMCGTHKSDFIMQQLNRCRHGIIRIPDRDDAGLRALKSWECNRHITVYINLQYKDIDEMCRVSKENIDWVNEYLRDCINWITSDTHKGQKSLCEEITVL